MNTTDPPETDTVPAEPAAPELVFRDVPWRLIHVVIGCVPLVAVLTFTVSPAARELPRAIGGLVFLLAETWTLAFPLALARWYGWRPRFALRPPRLVAEFLIAVLVVIALWVVLAVGYIVWVALFGEPPRSVDPTDRAARSGNPYVFLVLALLGVVIAPVTEEVFCRGMIYRALRRVAVWPLAVLIQAAVFGAFHASYGPTHVVVTGVMGVFLALVYDLRKTLVTPVFCHALHNAAVFVVAAWATGWPSGPAVLGVDGEPHEGGMRVATVRAGSGAEAAGIRSGDVLHTVNGRGVGNTEEVRAALRDKRPGDTVAVEYARDGQVHRVDVVLRSRKELPP